MLSALTRYYRPKSIAEALVLLQKNSGTVLVVAGGSKLLLTPNHVVRELVDISGLGLNHITEDVGAIRIGATTTLQSLIENDKINSLFSGIMAQAILLSQSNVMRRNTATLGGELVSTQALSPLYSALLVLQAQVRIVGGEEFALPMNIFLNKKTLAGGLLVEVLIPKANPQTYASIATTSATPHHPPVICACARLTLHNGRCKDVKIALTGVGRVPQRIGRAEQTLENQRPDNKMLENVAGQIQSLIEPISDSIASAEYRREAAGRVVKKALVSCLDRAEDELEF